MTRTRTQETRWDRLAGCGRSLGRFLGDQAGSNFIIVALTFPILLGMAGIGVDAVLWYMNKRENQTLADSAAVAATMAVSRDAGISQTDLEKVVRDSTKANGFVHGTHGTVIVNNPPAAGPNAGHAGFVEVIVQEQSDLYFSRMMVSNAFTVQARAVGGISTFGSHCVVALDPTADGAISVDGTANMTSACGIATNSSSDKAVHVQGTATLDAQPVQAYGDILESGGGTVVYNVPPQPLSERIEDPYAGVLPGLMADASCVGTNQPHALGSAESPVSPGRFCGGIKVNSGDVDFLPGLYILDNGGFTQTGGNIFGDGVTFVLTAMHASDIGGFDISGGTIDLRAPTAAEVDQGGGGDQGDQGGDDQGDQGGDDQGDQGGGGDQGGATGGYEGMLFIQDPYVPDIATYHPLPSNKFNGGSNMTLDGALYFPNTHVTYNGGAEGGVNCTLIVSKTVTFSGNVVLENDANACLEAGVKGIQQTRVRLFE